jgi:hypothetical protein
MRMGRTLCVRVSAVLDQHLRHAHMSLHAREVQRRLPIAVFYYISGLMHDANRTYPLHSRRRHSQPVPLPHPHVPSGMRDAAASTRHHLLRCEQFDARCRRDILFAFVSAPFSTSTLTTSTCPLWHAKCSGVHPLLSVRCEWFDEPRRQDIRFAFTSAPCMTSSFATSAYPFLHARSSGTCPSSAFAV